MFKENQRYRQISIYGMVHQFSPSFMKRLEKSWAPLFRKTIFEKIDERRFAGLYSDIKSRPNFPVNIWVGLEIIKWMFDYTDEELLDQFHFNLLIARALGQNNLGDITLSERTLYYNRERLLEYEAHTGRNLLEEEFKAITDETLSELKIDTKIQRMDSSFVGSFIKKMTRLELIAKVLQNFYRELPEVEQVRWKERLADYLKDEADHIAYQLRRSEVEEHLQKLGNLLFELHQAYSADLRISATKSYQHVSRVLLEQYNIVVNSEQTLVEVKPCDEFRPASMQNPADDTATYRTKGGTGHIGDIFNIAETCTPQNPLQLLTDVSVYPNTTSDDAILIQRASLIKERTDLNELITDGGYSGEKSEAACHQAEITLIPTAVKGASRRSEMTLDEFHFEGNALISCPEGVAPINRTYRPEKGQHIAYFAKEPCDGCYIRQICRVKMRARFYSLGYKNRQVQVLRRRQQLGEEAYRKKCQLRPAIEGTISQFKRVMHHGKLRLRGLNRIRNGIILMAIGINFGRLWGFAQESKLGKAVLLAISILFLMYLASRWQKVSLIRDLEPSTNLIVA
jgi:hypothetical protein